MTHISSRALTMLAVVAALCSTGCVYRNGVSTCRFWADYNTLMTPAIFFEETDHLPYHEARIEHYRWMYNSQTVAQRHRGALYPAAVYPAGVYPAGVAGSHSLQPPVVNEPSVPVPSDPAADEPLDEPETHEHHVPPLPSKLPQQLKLFDDGPAPDNPIPASPKPQPQPQEIDGPTALKSSPRGSRRN